MILSRARARVRACVPLPIHGEREREREGRAMNLTFHNFDIFSNHQAINFLLHLLFVVNGEKQKRLEKD